MAQHQSSIGRLEQQVESEPKNHRVRRQLVEALLDAGDVESAAEHLEILTEALPEEPWVLVLGLDVATQAKDSFQIARYRRALRSVLDEEELEDLYSPSLHPSSAAPRVAEILPRFRLLTGGGESPAQQVLNGSVPHSRLDDMADAATRRQLADRAHAFLTGDSGAGWRGGTLLYGPPSCGKSFAARALAGELGAGLWAFDLHATWEISVLEDSVAEAIEHSSEQPSVIYFHNLDAYPGQRGSAVVEPLLSLLDSGQTRGDVMIMGGATYPWHIAPGLLGPQRLGNLLLLPPPDRIARRAFLEQRAGAQLISTGRDLERLASETEGFSFDNLERLVELLTQSGSDPAVDLTTLEDLGRASTRTAAEWFRIVAHQASETRTEVLYGSALFYLATHDF